MANKPKKQAKQLITSNEPDTIYFLKLVGYLIIGSLWIKLDNGVNAQLPVLPLGFIVGLILARHDHIQMDRKIGYAILLVAMLIGFWAPFGIYITV